MDNFKNFSCRSIWQTIWSIHDLANTFFLFPGNNIAHAVSYLDHPFFRHFWGIERGGRGKGRKEGNTESPSLDQAFWWVLSGEGLTVAPFPRKLCLEISDHKCIGCWLCRRHTVLGSHLGNMLHNHEEYLSWAFLRWGFTHDAVNFLPFKTDFISWLKT